MPAKIRVANPFRYKAPTCNGFVWSSWVLEIASLKALPLSRDQSGQATVFSLVCLSRELGIMCHARQSFCYIQAQVPSDTSARRRALGLLPVCRKDIRACPHVHQTVGLIIYPCPSSERVLASGAEVPRLEV